MNDLLHYYYLVSSNKILIFFLFFRRHWRILDQNTSQTLLMRCVMSKLLAVSNVGKEESWKDDCSGCFNFQAYDNNLSNADGDGSQHQYWEVGIGVLCSTANMLHLNLAFLCSHHQCHFIFRKISIKIDWHFLNCKVCGWVKACPCPQKS